MNDNEADPVTLSWQEAWSEDLCQTQATPGRPCAPSRIPDSKEPLHGPLHSLVFLPGSPGHLLRDSASLATVAEFLFLPSLWACRAQTQLRAYLLSV